MTCDITATATVPVTATPTVTIVTAIVTVIALGMATQRITVCSSPQHSLPAGVWTMLTQLRKTSVVGTQECALVLRRIVMSDRATLLRLDPNPDPCIR